MNCVYCSEPVDPSHHTTWRRVTGWERKATAGSRRGGSDIVLREPRDEYACAGCIGLLQAGVILGQASLV